MIFSIISSEFSSSEHWSLGASSKGWFSANFNKSLEENCISMGSNKIFIRWSIGSKLFFNRFSAKCRLKSFERQKMGRKSSIRELPIEISDPTIYGMHHVRNFDQRPSGRGFTVYFWSLILYPRLLGHLSNTLKSSNHGLRFLI